MNGLVSFLLVAAVFFLMMRFGCGAHAGHGGHGDHQGGTSPARNDIDPVCGMKVPPDGGYARQYGSAEYRFCSRECLDKFDANPRQYLTGGPRQHSHEEGRP